MKILVRLPNWLGDMVMSVGFLNQLPHFFPGAEVSVIIKKGLHQLLPFFPPIKHQFIFSKEEYRGLKGTWDAGRVIKRKDAFDLFFSLPDSFSSALMGFASGAKKRVGYKKEAREILLTNAYTKPVGKHRVEEYMALLEAFTSKPSGDVNVSLRHQFIKGDTIIININSEASSRRLTTVKAVEIISAVQENFSNRIVLIGSPNEKEFVTHVLSKLPLKEGVESVAGGTSLPELCEVIAGAQLMLSTDSGPAHLANALGTPTVVLFGAGNENNTSPYNKSILQTIRLGKLSCEPCTKNTCVQFGTPQCLELLEVPIILSAMKQLSTQS